MFRQWNLLLLTTKNSFCLLPVTWIVLFGAVTSNLLFANGTEWKLQHCKLNLQRSRFAFPRQEEGEGLLLPAGAAGVSVKPNLPSSWLNVPLWALKGKPSACRFEASCLPHWPQTFCSLVRFFESRNWSRCQFKWPQTSKLFLVSFLPLPGPLCTPVRLGVNCCETLEMFSHRGRGKYTSFLRCGGQILYYTAQGSAPHPFSPNYL